MAPNNPLVVWGNEKTMNLNPLILTNIQSSPYFKVNLYELKTYHEVIDEIYFKVDHLEPWEKGSRKTAGQTGMCGGVRGVGAGGIVSSAFCLLYKLFTLKLTKKQVIGLITHQDSPYIRGLGFMYIRYTQPPQELWDWFDEYLDDDEDIDVKAGGGHTMTIGEMLRHWLTKLEWYSTLFPRIPVPVQKDIDEKLKNRVFMQTAQKALEETEVSDDRSTVIETDGRKKRSRTPDRRYERSRDRYARRSPSHKMSPCPPSHHTAQDDFALELAREQERQRRERDRNGRTEEHRSRSRSKGQHRVSLKYKNKSKIKEKIPAHYFWQSQSWSREKHSRRSQSQEYKHSKASCKKQSCSKDKHYSHKDKKEYSNRHEKETTRKVSEGKQNGAI